MRYILLLFLVLLVVNCQINYTNIKERPKPPRIENPAKPDYAKFEEIEKRIEQVFSMGSEPLQYTYTKNPFMSAIDIYLSSQNKRDVDNPLAIPLNRIKVVGIMDSNIGRLGVVEALNQIFFVRVGDKIGDADGVITEITTTGIKVRETRKDIYGEYHTSIIDLYISREEKR